MNLLECVNRTRQECGVSGADLTTVVGVSGESKRVRDWVVQAWIELQEEHQHTFDFMRKSASFDTVIGQQAYTPSDAVPTGIALTDFGGWAKNSFRLYNKALGVANEMFLSYMDYTDFRDFYQYASYRLTQSRPISIAINPSNKALLLGPNPDAVYTVVGEYFCNPVTLSLDADTPAMPSRFHMAIVYRAMQSYALYEAAPEVMTRGQTGYSEVLKRIEEDQLQPVLVAGALA